MSLRRYYAVDIYFGVGDMDTIGKSWLSFKATCI